MPSGFTVGKEAGSDGSFDRQESEFRDWISDDGSTKFPLEPGRYHLFVSWACPWAHRSIIARRLMGLQEAIGMSVVNPYRDKRGWEFTGGEYANHAEPFTLLADAYKATEEDFGDRASTPVLWDTQSKEIVSNESADVLRMLHTVFKPLAEHPVSTCGLTHATSTRCPALPKPYAWTTSAATTTPPTPRSTRAV